LDPCKRPSEKDTEKATFCATVCLLAFDEIAKKNIFPKKCGLTENPQNDHVKKENDDLPLDFWAPYVQTNPNAVLLSRQSI